MTRIAHSCACAAAIVVAAVLWSLAQLLCRGFDRPER